MSGARRLLAHRLLPRRGRTHRLLPPGHPRLHRSARPQRIRPHRHRSLPNADSPHQHPCHQHLGQPRPQHRPRNLRRRSSTVATMALLGSPHHRSHHRSTHLPDLLRRPTRNPSAKKWRQNPSHLTGSEFVERYELASTTGASTTLPRHVTAITITPTTTEPSAATCALLIPQ